MAFGLLICWIVLLGHDSTDFGSGERRLGMTILLLSGPKDPKDFEPSMDNLGLAPLILDKESGCLFNLIVSLMLILVIL